VVWLKPAAVAAAVVRRDGRVQAAGRPADHARLGTAEEHRSHDYRAVTVGDLEVGSIDRSLIRVPDTPANRRLPLSFHPR
jgi:hypothetical protein